MADYTLRLLIDGDSAGATSALNSASSALNSFGGNAMKAGGILSAGITLPILAIGKAAIDAGTKLNAAMANIGSMGVAIPRVNELKKAIQDLAVQTGATTDDLAKGTYQIISAFGDTADTTKILALNTKIAAAGVATLTDTVDMVSIVTQNWGDTSLKAQEHIGDLALKTVALGKTTLPALAQSLGGVAPMAHAAGLSTEELFAVMATGSGIIGTTSEVVTKLSRTIGVLEKPNKELAAVIKANGFASGDAMIKELGFEGAIMKIKQAADKAGVAVIQLTKSKESAGLITAFTTTLSQKYADNLKAEGEASGMTNAAYAAQTEGVNAMGHAIAVATQQTQVWLQNINDGLGPAFGALGAAIAPAVTYITGLTESFKNASPETKKWIVGLAAGAAAIGPVLLAVGSFSRAIAFFIPLASGMATTLLGLAIPLGLLYGAYRLNVLGLGDLVNNGLHRVQAAAPLAEAALKSVWLNLTGSRDQIGTTTAAVYNFVQALTGSNDAGLAAVNWVVGLGTQIHDLEDAYTKAGGGIKGFAAALSQATGKDIKIDLTPNIVKVTWGDVFDFSAGFPMGDLTKGFVKLKANDVFDFSVGFDLNDWSKGFVKLSVGDVFDFSQDWTQGITHLHVKDLIDFDKSGSGTKLNIKDFLSFDTEQEHLQFGDWFVLDKGVVTHLNFGDWFVMDNGLTHLKFGDWFVMDNGTVNHLKFGDWYVMDHDGEKIHEKVGNFYDFTAGPSGITRLSFGDWYKMTNDGKKIQEKIGDWYELDQSPAGITHLKFGDFFTFDKAKGGPTKLSIGDWFAFDTSKLSINPLTYFPITTKYTMADVFGFSFAGIKLSLERVLMWADVFSWPQLMPLGVANQLGWGDVFSFAKELTLSVAKLLGFSEVFGFTLDWSPNIHWPQPPGWLGDFMTAVGMGGGATQAAPSSASHSAGSFGRANGDPSFPGGRVLIGEAGSELVQTTDGKWAMATGPTLTNLPAGTKIYKHSDTESMMKGGLESLPNFAGGTQGPGFPGDNPFGTNFFGPSQGQGPIYNNQILGPFNPSNVQQMTLSLVDISKHAAVITKNTDGTHKTLLTTAVRMQQEEARRIAFNLAHFGNAPAQAAGSAGQGLGVSFKEMQQAGMDIAKAFKGTTAEFESFIKSVPGLFGTSQVTAGDMEAAKAGTYVQKADEKLRQLRDLAEHGVNYPGMNPQEFKDALNRIGIVASNDLKTLAQQATTAWNDNTLFSDKKNMGLINIAAVKAQMMQQQKQSLGSANIMEMFGITDAAVQAGGVATGKKARTALQSGLTGALTGVDATGKATAGSDSLIASLAGDMGKQVIDSTAFGDVGAAILQKITSTWSDASKLPDMIGPIGGALKVQIGGKDGTQVLFDSGAAIFKTIMTGYQDAATKGDFIGPIAAAIAKSTAPSTTGTGTTTVTVPKKAGGTNFWTGGLVHMNESGGEIVDLPRGSRIYPHDVSQKMAAQGGGDTHVWNVTVSSPLDVEMLAYKVAQVQNRRRG